MWDSIFSVVNWVLAVLGGWLLVSFFGAVVYDLFRRRRWKPDLPPISHRFLVGSHVEALDAYPIFDLLTPGDVVVAWIRSKGMADSFVVFLEKEYGEPVKENG